MKPREDVPFAGYSADELREGANYLARQQEKLRPRTRWRHDCFDSSGLIAMSWVSHTLDALDLLELVVDEWDTRGDGGCTKAIQDRVREALRGGQ